MRPINPTELGPVSIRSVVGVIGHTTDRDQFLSSTANDTGNVFLQLFFIPRLNDASACRHSEDNVNLNFACKYLPIT